MPGEVTPPRIFRITPAKRPSVSMRRTVRLGRIMPPRPRHPLARSCRCELPDVNRPVWFNGWFHRGPRTWLGRQRRTGHPGRIRADTHLWSGRAACGMSRRNRPYGGLDCSCRSGPRKAQRRKYPEGRVACGNELSDARAGYRAVLYISGISSTWSRESLAKAKHITRSSHRSHVP